MTLDSLKPTSRQKVFDLAQEAGFDVTDWIQSSNKPNAFKANPKYCYEWAYVQPGEVVVLNLWFSAMREQDGRIFQWNNFRADVEHHRFITKKPTWAKRAQRIDEAIQLAAREQLPVRVIVNHGVQPDKHNPKLIPSSVKARKLDPEPWTVTSYDWATGQHELTRGSGWQKYVDQFDLIEDTISAARKITITASSFVRSPAIRRNVLRRADGRCELCGERGFKMANGAIYLETHHIVPLAEGGADSETNVVALCPNDHKRAHFAVEHQQIAAELQNAVRMPGGTRPL